MSNNLDNINLINKGSDGEIYSFEKDKIIKIVNLERLNLLEIEILTKIDSIYISKAIKILIENYKIKIYQYRADCDLSLWISINRKNYFSIQKKIKYIKQVINGVYDLSKKNILHGDIKTSNILVYNDILKLNDFNRSIKLQKNNQIKPLKKLYTLGYRPPECNEGIYSLKSDVWALGCTIYEIYYGKKYFKFDDSGLQYHLKNLEENKLENNFINKIISKAIVKDPDKRISIQELFEIF